VSALAVSAFDPLAETYDQQWSDAPSGRLQRQAVWRVLDPLVRSGDNVLDLGCGTGEDALHLVRLGARVIAVDASREMVRQARRKGVDARVMKIEEAGKLKEGFDLVLSNFGALNCVRGLGGVAESLARLIRPGGILAVCLMGRFCLWESSYYAVLGDARKAARRWFGETAASIGIRVFYPTAGQARAAFAPWFELISDIGVGVFVPPSFARGPSPELVARLGRFDQRPFIAKAGRFLSDHRLFVLRRLGERA
jgi:SAM-dependent methyltransferase